MIGHMVYSGGWRWSHGLLWRLEVGTLHRAWWLRIGTKWLPKGISRGITKNEEMGDRKANHPGYQEVKGAKFRSKRCAVPLYFHAPCGANPRP